MERRQVLAAAATLPSLLLAGCTGSSGTANPDGTTSSSGPSYQSNDLTVIGSSCATQDAEDASVSFDDTTVTVTGTIVGADSCYSARIADAQYDPDADELTLLVESFNDREQSGGCAQCITAIDYEAVASFKGGLPGTVVVQHGGWEDDHTVTTASP